MVVSSILKTWTSSCLRGGSGRESRRKSGKVKINHNQEQGPGVIRKKLVAYVSYFKVICVPIVYPSIATFN